MLTKEQIFSLHRQWEEQHLPEISHRLGAAASNTQLERALFRVFDSLIWGLTRRHEARMELASANNDKTALKAAFQQQNAELHHRTEMALVTLEAAGIAEPRQAFMAVLAVVHKQLFGARDLFLFTRHSAHAN